MIARAVVIAAALTFAGPAQSATFQVGLTDPNPVPAADAAALGVSVSRQTVFWNGEASFSGTLGFSAGVTPFVLVLGGRAIVPRSDSERNTLCAFANSILTRYPQVRYLGLWGEIRPWHSTWQWDAAYPPSLYGAMIRACAPVVHAHGAKLVALSAHPMNSEVQPLLNALKGTGVDVVSADPYWEYSLDTEFVRRVRATLGNLPVWAAEDGIESSPAPAFASLYNGVQPWDYWVAEDRQPAYLAAHMLSAYCAGFSVWLNFLLRDQADLDRWQSGLERPDGSHKPSYAAFAATRQLIASGQVDCSQPVVLPPPASHFLEVPHEGQTGRHA